MFPIPKSKRKCALILVDIQHDFIKRWKKPFLKNLALLIKRRAYDLYVEVTFHADAGSLWDKETHWTFPYEPEIEEVQKLLKDKKTVEIVKETRSAWKGKPDLKRLLNRRGITEVHVVGFDSNDCVFATAQEAFDLGFYTHVIEECTGASQGLTVHKDAIEILRKLELTNHSK